MHCAIVSLFVLHFLQVTNKSCVSKKGVYKLFSWLFQINDHMYDVNMIVNVSAVIKLISQLQCNVIAVC